ncbi:MAG: hypothetical protein FGF48_10895 [Candidatus Brockarchaeota archaeon]|nr:hypothetical protein [Candidatus Brockarchaeota archaeon]
MAIVGDLHIGTPQSLWELCLSKLREIKPSRLVLLGDAFDFENGKPSLWEVTDFFRKLREISTEVIPVLGCSDSNPKGLLEVLRELSFSKEPLKPQLLKPSPVRAEALAAS